MIQSSTTDLVRNFILGVDSSDNNLLIITNTDDRSWQWPCFLLLSSFLSRSIICKEGHLSDCTHYNHCKYLLIVAKIDSTNYDVNWFYSHTRRFHSDETIYAKNISDSITGPQ